MSGSRLSIIDTAQKENVPSPLPSSRSLRNAEIKELQAKFERLWLIDPEQFNPLRNCMESERLERTWQILMTHSNPKEKQAVDIGCGMGLIAERLQNAEASHIDAVDIAENALKKIKEKNHKKISARWGAMPNTSLEDDRYDIVVCTELIGEIPKEEYRLFFAELARVIRSNGLLVCSSSIDINSEGGVEKLIELAQTEFDLIDAVKSYHRLYIRFKNLLHAPSLYTEGWAHEGFRQKELKKRKGLSRVWYWLNSSPLLVWLWYIVNPVAQSLLRHYKNNRRILLLFEKISRFLWDEGGVSHFLFIAKRRSLLTVDPSDVPIARPGKKEIWE